MSTIFVNEIVLFNLIILNLFLFPRSAWIEESNLKPYLEFKSQMMKLGKPKASFDKAIAEIEAYIKNPSVNNQISNKNPSLELL